MYGNKPTAIYKNIKIEINKAYFWRADNVIITEVPDEEKVVFCCVM